MTELKINPTFRDLIPPLSDYELEALEAELRHWARAYSPIISWNGTIVDGHHRYEICRKRGLPFKVEAIDFEDQNDAEIWIIRNQFSRRNLTDFIRGELALELKPRLKMQAEKRMKSGKSDPSQNFDQGYEETIEEKNKRHNHSRVDAEVGRIANISREQVRKIEKIKEKDPSEEELKKLREGKIAIHKKYTENTKEEHLETLKATEFPKGKFRVIYADPPWDYGSSPTCKNTATPDLKYPVMSIEDICALPVKDIADENAVLFLWTTSYHIFEASRVLEAWGFEYKSMFIWDKIKHNMGCYNSVRHEILLIATKGSCTPDNVELIDSVQTIERTKHSEKPERFRDIIETLYKYGNKLELFARKKIEGWNVYGNECN